MSERKLRKYYDQSQDANLGEQHHPLNTILFYGLSFSAIIFLSLLFVFLVWVENKADDVTIHLSKEFVVSPYVLLCSFFSATYFVRSYREDNNMQLLLSLATALISGVVFSVLQVYGCLSVFESNPLFEFNTGTIVLFVATGFHLLFMLTGLLYLFYLTLKSYDNWNDPIKSLVYFSNQYEVKRLELASFYWYFTCISWTVLFFTFYSLS
jgi:heme/copper-type cytochrome/quinol oxidase subunit 3